jgi:hypothetical protein
LNFTRRYGVHWEGRDYAVAIVAKPVTHALVHTGETPPPKKPARKRAAAAKPPAKATTAKPAAGRASAAKPAPRGSGRKK